MKLPMISLKKWWLKYLISVSLLLTSLQVISQELNCRIRVNADQIQISDRRIFKDMEVAFAQFLNSRKWTNDNYSNEEKINCNLTFTIDQMPSIGVFSSTVQIQSARPIYNANYESIILNFADRDWQFEYTESQPLDYSENSFISNLTSMLAFYANIILGLDYDTFSELGGTPYYIIAQNIVTNAQASNRQGWESLGSTRNRFWLIENLTNRLMVDFRKGFYTYHRLALDTYLENKEASRRQILNVLREIKKVNDVNPNQILIISFLDAKSDELVNIFSDGSLPVKREAFQLLTELDPTKMDKYNKIISN